MTSNSFKASKVRCQYYSISNVPTTQEQYLEAGMRGIGLTHHCFDI
jgi:hypothetical protein